ncbi:MAG: LapA family protein [Clostridia bacterium]|nr:LapA family protein [Clostridia bacterium]
MKKDNLLMSILLALFTFLGVIFGLLLMQPKINKLRKQVKNLQENTERLLELERKHNNDFANLLLQYKGLKALQIKKKTEMKEKMRETLVLEYGLKEYLDILYKRVKEKVELSQDEIKFYKSYDNVVEGNKLSRSDMEHIRKFIIDKYAINIDKLIECDCSESINRLENIDG